MAVIISKNPLEMTLGGSEKEAYEFDEFMMNLMKDIEGKLKKEKLLNVKRKDYNIKYYRIGVELRTALESGEIKRDDHRQWFFRIAELYASDNLVNLKDRSAGRENFRYFYYLAKFDLQDVKKWYWGEWCYILDSRSFLSDPRSIKWLIDRFSKISNFDRPLVRSLVKFFNKEIYLIKSIRSNKFTRDLSRVKNSDFYKLYDDTLELFFEKIKGE